MPTAVQCLIDDHQAYAIARVVGVLDGSGAAAVRTALIKCLAEQPEAVLVDLSEMRLADPNALSIFLAVARQAERWPAVPLVLCAPQADAAELLRLRSRDRPMPVLPSLADAVRSLDLGSAAPSISEDLLPVVGAGRRAREIATEVCFQWEVPGLVGPACTVVTEFVNNVVAHAHTMMTLRLSLRDRCLHIAVRDGSAAEPVLRRAVSHTALAGRGLALVDAVARHWGTLPTEGGKVVWAMLDEGPPRR
ncbi:STAS domain-containing protein [Phytohabitans suffuscus]|uniref:Anti-anti-sigma factor n=1 Tax=Phytohabitans suffuscus TaxID=624315 RepID=A0A6F8YLI8_9ACTN|nr:STAS domain-containing protein [Phytohabitans suffuscus]BCB87005.1 anti-anti-sigma factor [Phytohabitans suffuscus]